MAQLNITLNQEEIQALLLEDQGEAFKKILQASLNNEARKLPLQQSLP